MQAVAVNQKETHYEESRKQKFMSK